MSSSGGSAGLFDRWSQNYDRESFQTVTYRPVHDAVLRRLDDTAPRRVLDLGCGTGQLTLRLVERFPVATVVGVDLSDGMLARAAERLAGPGVSPPELVRADAGALSFAASSVDVVVCTESFHWYPEQARVLDGIAEVLSDSGRLLIASVATVTDFGERVLRRATAGTSSPVRALPPGRLRRLLERSGFRVVDQRRIPRLSPAGWPVLTDARLA